MQDYKAELLKYQFPQFQKHHIFFWKHAKMVKSNMQFLMIKSLMATGILKADIIDKVDFIN